MSISRDYESNSLKNYGNSFLSGEDIRRFADNILPASDSTIHFGSLNLHSGQRYYSNIRAFNKAGLHILRSSDGFVVDLRRPDSGLVFDGIGMHVLTFTYTHLPVDIKQTLAFWNIVVFGNLSEALSCKLYVCFDPL